MRVWHEQLIPLLCRQHLLATWREGLGAYAIITGTTITKNGAGYRNHPAVKEFEKCHCVLWARLCLIREEMLARSYQPKDLPPFQCIDVCQEQKYVPWQTLEEQIEVLRSKKCNCKI